MRREIDVEDAGPYRAPAQLRMRSDFAFKDVDGGTRVFEANE